MSTIEKEIWEEDVDLPQSIHESEINGFKNKEYLYKFALDQWYDDLEEFTFKTVFLPLSVDEALAMVHPNGEGSDVLVQQIENRLDDAIDRFDFGGFVKLNHRSPKDVAIVRENAYVKTLVWDSLVGVAEDDKITQAIVLNRALLSSLRVISGSQAMRLLLNSYRIREDILLDAKYPEFWKSKLVVREFREIDPSMEFRGFVHHGKLNALSQYESGIYYPNLVVKQDEILEFILKFFEEVSPKINLKSYVIDFAVFDDGEVKIVELNPFMTKTSGCLFSWGEDRDIIFNGPFTFRILNTVPEDPLEHLFTYHIDSYYEDQIAKSRGWKVRMIFSIMVASLLYYFAL